MPGRGEYWKVNAEENLAASTTRRVSAKSSSVSPGKPTMTSEVIAASGSASRTRSRMPRNRSERYDRRIARSTRSDPDCSGMCRLGITVGVWAMAAITSSVKAAGCGEVNRTRSSPGTPPTARSRSANAPRSPNPTP